MSPESLVLQPKVTEVRLTEQPGPAQPPAVVPHPSDQSVPVTLCFCRRGGTLKWCKRGPTLKKTYSPPHRGIPTYAHTKPPSILDHRTPPPQPAFNQGYNPLTVALSLSLSVMPISVLTCPLLQFVFSLFLSADSH